MNRRLGVTLAFVLGCGVVGSYSVAQTLVDQGKPGRQGPWPVTVSGTTIDGGVPVTVTGLTFTDAGVAVAVPYCTVTASKQTSVGLTSTAVPASPLAGRWSIRVCNSLRNTSGNPVVTCTSDGTTPTALANSAGDTLAPGDCAQFYGGSVINCISDTASTAVTSEECR